MTRLKRILSFVLIFSVIFSIASINISMQVSAATAKIAFINGNSVTVRKGAGTSYGKVDSISYRQVDVLSTKGEWLKVSYIKSGKTYTGYIKNVSDWVHIISYDLEESFTEQLSNFPTSYRTALKTLHSKYPNWKFIPEKVNVSFDDIVALESINSRKQVQLSGQPVSWRSMDKGYYDWSTNEWIVGNGGWTGASREVIRYYMDPRNFLDDENIYMFLSQSYGYGDYTEAGLKKIVKGTFLEKGYSDPDNKEGYKGSYINLLLAAGEQSGVSPYILASKIIQEQGAKGTSPLISGTYSGYNGYYNFFNWNASGSNNDAVIKNGLAYAKKQGWNTRAKSIIGGAKMYSDGYLEVGQDTYYYQDFNVHFTDNLWHQYAQAVHDAYNKGRSLSKQYTDITDAELVFRIPVFGSMPTSKCPKPVQNSKKNNYYFTSIKINGLTPSFYRFTYNYDLQVTGDAVMEVICPSTATMTSATEFSLKKGNNTVVLKVKSETGYTTSYTVNVNATKAATLYINKPASGNSSGTTSSGNSSTSTSKIKLGDIDADGNITVNDMARIRLHLLNRYSIKGTALKSADIDNDSKVTVNDMARIRLHLLGKYKIK